MGDGILERTRKSAVELHRVFALWFGTGGAESILEPVEEVLAPDFAMVTPDGSLRARDAVLERLRSAGGTLPGLAIEVRAARIVAGRGGLVVLAYEEWQRSGPVGAWRGRASTAVLEEDAAVRWSYRWRFVQETWIAGPTGTEQA